MFKKTLLSSLSALMLVLPAQAANYTIDDAYDAQAVLQDYLEYWEAGKIKKLEFLLHNKFVSAAGENKWKFIKRLKKEAGNMAGRQIKHQWKGAKNHGPYLRVKYFLDYTDQYKKYTGSKYFHSCQNVTLNFTKSKGKMYIIREWATKSKCPN